jgi:hypothetical protein
LLRDTFFAHSPFTFKRYRRQGKGQLILDARKAWSAAAEASGVTAETSPASGSAEKIFSRVD